MNDVTDPVSGEEKVRFNSGGSRGFGFGESGGRPRQFASTNGQLMGRQVTITFTAPLPEVAARAELVRLPGGHYAPFPDAHERAGDAESSFRRRPVLDSPVGSTASGERR
ncbi:hypothetical protein [Streptomyces sp. NBC_01483]|uniref:hypothetical protein n=1 Tax=Streptomyces sp. NBC_01483 TaxID=2903883 RepID=UPI002E36D738|nr:hypothetical protein [Streptomyces sp. NBC_01483]